MVDKTVIKAGGLDNGEANLRNKVDVEFYVKDRISYLGAVDGAKQEPHFGWVVGEQPSGNICRAWPKPGGISEVSMVMFSWSLYRTTEA